MPEEYNEDVERRPTHPLLMPKVESEPTSAADCEMLEKAAIVAPTRSPAKKTKKGILQGACVESILPQVKPTAKQRSVLSEDKYAPGEGSKWKHVSARFPALYKVLLAEPDEVVRSCMLRTTVHLAG